MGSVAEKEVMNQTPDAQRPTFPVEVSAEDTTSNVKHRTNIIWRIIGFIVTGIFVYAGAIKALDPVQFANDIDNYKTLPWFVTVRLALYLPWLEILCGLAVISRFLYRGGLSILTALLAVFIGATVAAKLRGLDITCGCFGHASQNWNFSTHLVLDFSIFAAILALLFANSRHRVEL